ncbi:MAG: glycerate kinase [Phycisphaerales bacterium]|nr:glycerate kinase [Phycisphaerales bacterium]
MGKPISILICPDKFKGSLTATQAAEAMARGAVRAGERAGRRVAPSLWPMSDGGEGFLESALAEHGRGELRSCTVTGPTGEPVEARWLYVVQHSEILDAEIPTACIESAQAAGLHLVPKDRRDPTRATTFGVGELIRAAADAGCRFIVVGLGGSATVDGGIGMAAALGARFLDANGNELEPVGANLGRIAAVDRTRLGVRGPDGQPVTVAGCRDVDSPLLGPEGAAAVFGPQKGATPEQVRQLDEGLANLARVAWPPSRQRPDAVLSGLGAAGGLAFGLAAFGGVALWMDTLALSDDPKARRRFRAARLVLTGEGKFDPQTLRGKVVAQVCAAAGEARRPVAVIAGDAEKPEEVRAELERRGCRVIAVRTLVGPGVSREEAERSAAALLEQAADDVVSAWLNSGLRGWLRRVGLGRLAGWV